MSEYQEMVLLKLIVPMVILIVTAFVYFIFNKNKSMWNRLFAASHSFLACIAAIYATIVGEYTSATSFDPHTLNFSKILAVAVIIAFVAVLYFKGNKKVHFLLFPFLLCVAYIWHVGGMAITHNWA